MKTEVKTEAQSRAPVHYIDVRRPKKGIAYPLRTHLAMGFGVSAILLSAFMSYAVGHLAAEKTTAIIGSNFAMLAEELRDKLDYGLQDRVRDVSVLATVDARIMTEDPSVLRRVRIRELQRLEPNFAWVGYVDANGVVKTASDGLLEGTNVAQTDWFQRGLKDTVTGRVRNAPYNPPRARDEPMRVLDIAVPLKDTSGRVTGVLAANLDWTWAQQMRQTLLDMPTDRGMADVLVLSQSGEPLLGAKSGEELYVPRKMLETTDTRGRWSIDEWPDGREYVSAIAMARSDARATGDAWFVMIRQPAEEALDPARSLQLRIVVAGALVGLAFALFAWWFAEEVAKPLKLVADAAEHLGDEGGATEIPMADGYGEIEQLTASLRHMVSRLNRHEEEIRQARDKLELRVRERSAEATRTRAELQSVIVEREHAQRNLMRAMERLEFAMRAAGIAVWHYDPATGVVELSAEWARMLGEPPRVVTTTIDALSDRVPENERAMVRGAITAALQGTEPQYVIRHHIVRANGARVLTESRGEVVDRDAAGRVVRMIGTIMRVSLLDGTRDDGQNQI